MAKTTLSAVAMEQQYASLCGDMHLLKRFEDILRAVAADESAAVTGGTAADSLVSLQRPSSTHLAQSAARFHQLSTHLVQFYQRMVARAATVPPSGSAAPSHADLLADVQELVEHISTFLRLVRGVLYVAGKNSHGRESAAGDVTKSVADATFVLQASTLLVNTTGKLRIELVITNLRNVINFLAKRNVIAEPVLSTHGGVAAAARPIFADIQETLDRARRVVEEWKNEYDTLNRLVRASTANSSGKKDVAASSAAANIDHIRRVIHVLRSIDIFEPSKKSPSPSSASLPSSDAPRPTCHALASAEVLRGTESEAPATVESHGGASVNGGALDAAQGALHRAVAIASAPPLAVACHLGSLDTANHTAVFLLERKSTDLPWGINVRETTSVAGGSLEMLFLPSSASSEAVAAFRTGVHPQGAESTKDPQLRSETPSKRRAWIVAVNGMENVSSIVLLSYLKMPWDKLALKVTFSDLPPKSSAHAADTTTVPLAQVSSLASAKGNTEPEQKAKLSLSKDGKISSAIGKALTMRSIQHTGVVHNATSVLLQRADSSRPWGLTIKMSKDKSGGFSVSDNAKLSGKLFHCVQGGGEGVLRQDLWSAGDSFTKLLNVLRSEQHSKLWLVAQPILPLSTVPTKSPVPIVTQVTPASFTITRASTSVPWGMRFRNVPATGQKPQHVLLEHVSGHKILRGNSAKFPIVSLIAGLKITSCEEISEKIKDLVVCTIHFARQSTCRIVPEVEDVAAGNKVSSSLFDTEWGRDSVAFVRRDGNSEPWPMTLAADSREGVFRSVASWPSESIRELAYRDLIVEGKESVLPFVVDAAKLQLPSHFAQKQIALRTISEWALKAQPGMLKKNSMKRLSTQQDQRLFALWATHVNDEPVSRSTQRLAAAMKDVVSRRIHLKLRKVRR